MLFQAESKEIQVTDHPMQWNPVTPVLGPQKPETEVNPQPPCEQDVVIKIRDLSPGDTLWSPALPDLAALSC